MSDQNEVNNLIKRIDLRLQEMAWSLIIYPSQNRKRYSEEYDLLKDCRAEIERRKNVPSIDTLIAEAVAKEREVCAQIAMDFWCDAGAEAIRARGQK